MKLIEHEIVDFINKTVREEHGNRITIDSKLIDCGVDSFGISMVLLALDEKYSRFSSEWLEKNSIEDLTIKTIVERVTNDSN